MLNLIGKNETESYQNEQIKGLKMAAISILLALFFKVAPKQPRQRRALGQGQPHCYVAAQRLVSSVGHWHFTRRVVSRPRQAVLEKHQIEGMRKPWSTWCRLFIVKKNGEKNHGEKFEKTTQKKTSNYGNSLRFRHLYTFGMGDSCTLSEVI